MHLTLATDQAFKGCLPSDFAYGYASASFQIEGCYDKDGCGSTIWHDALSRDQPDLDLETCKSYEMWREDVKILKESGSNAYRFSIAWARIIPLGGKDDPINEKGIEYYNNLINALLEAGITPYLTVYHWDLPSELQKRYNGWRAENPDDLVQDFVRFARVCFERFGDRVKHWITFNEPLIANMLHAVSLVKDFDLRKDPFTIGRCEILAHAYTVKCYRDHFQQEQKGTIGITLNCDWNEPIDDTPEAKKAAQQCVDKVLGWYADPIFLGKPTNAWDELGGPDHSKFSEEEWKVIKGSSDFFGINHYGTAWTTAENAPEQAGPMKYISFFFGGVKTTFEKDGKLIGRRGESGHPHTVPWGFRKLLNHISTTYTKELGIPILVTENGFPVENEWNKNIDEIVEDTYRQEYFDQYLRAMCEAVKDDGIDIKAYLGWSLVDNLEWGNGYNPRFGVTYIDKANGYKRIPKKSIQTNKSIFEHVVSK